MICPHSLLLPWLEHRNYLYIIYTHIFLLDTIIWMVKTKLHLVSAPRASGPHLLKINTTSSWTSACVNWLPFASSFCTPSATLAHEPAKKMEEMQCDVHQVRRPAPSAHRAPKLRTVRSFASDPVETTERASTARPGGRKEGAPMLAVDRCLKQL